MSKHKRPFLFKQFAVAHSRSTMKVGIDAVVLGAWVEIGDRKKILEVGCGCGVISLMLAQRANNVDIVGIDIDANSLAEAFYNVCNSPWGDRIKILMEDFCKMDEKKFDLIVSNPPYFDSGICNPSSSRLRARHIDNLSPLMLLNKGAQMLNKGGGVAMVVPYEYSNNLIVYAKDHGWQLKRLLNMRGSTNNKFKRAFLQFELCQDCRTTDNLAVDIDILNVRNCHGQYSKEYKNLCRDFYLSF